MEGRREKGGENVILQRKGVAVVEWVVWVELTNPTPPKIPVLYNSIAVLYNSNIPHPQAIIDDPEQLRALESVSSMQHSRTPDCVLSWLHNRVLQGVFILLRVCLIHIWIQLNCPQGLFCCCFFTLPSAYHTLSHSSLRDGEKKEKRAREEKKKRKKEREKRDRKEEKRGERRKEERGEKEKRERAKREERKRRKDEKREEKR